MNRIRKKSSLASSNNEHSIVELSAPDVNNPNNNEDHCIDMTDSVILTELAK